MKLGAFSISLAVQDLATSKQFYETLGFEVAGDFSDQGWCILRSDSTTIGLFEKMFEGNLLTFNPGWNQDAQPLDGPFEDVRAIQERLQNAGLELERTTEPGGTGPGSIVLRDPDGNVVLIDQHV